MMDKLMRVLGWVMMALLRLLHLTSGKPDTPPKPPDDAPTPKPPPDGPPSL